MGAGQLMQKTPKRQCDTWCQVCSRRFVFVLDVRPEPGQDKMSRPADAWAKGLSVIRENTHSPTSGTPRHERECFVVRSRLTTGWPNTQTHTEAQARIEKIPVLDGLLRSGYTTARVERKSDVHTLTHSQSLTGSFPVVLASYDSDTRWEKMAVWVNQTQLLLVWLLHTLRNSTQTFKQKELLTHYPLACQHQCNILIHSEYSLHMYAPSLNPAACVFFFFSNKGAQCQLTRAFLSAPCLPGLFFMSCGAWRKSPCGIK